MQKECKKCKNIKPLEEFDKQSTCKDGRRATCSECRSRYAANYYKNNKVRIKGVVRLYQSNNKEEVRGRTLAWESSNRDRKSFHTRRWEVRNAHKVNAKVAKRRATKLRATPKWLSQEQLREIRLFYEVAKWIQTILGVEVHVDHIVPLQGKGVCGLHVPWNLQILTSKDNLRKNNRYIGAD